MTGMILAAYGLLTQTGCAEDEKTRLDQAAREFKRLTSDDYMRGADEREIARKYGVTVSQVEDYMRSKSYRVRKIRDERIAKEEKIEKATGIEKRRLSAGQLNQNLRSSYEFTDRSYPNGRGTCAARMEHDNNYYTLVFYREGVHGSRGQGNACDLSDTQESGHDLDFVVYTWTAEGFIEQTDASLAEQSARMLLGQQRTDQIFGREDDF